MTDSATTMNLSLHIIGDAFVDLFCRLEAGLPEKGGDARLDNPIQTMAGGSAVNTATHLTSLLRHFCATTPTTDDDDNDDDSSRKDIETSCRPLVQLQTVVNPKDEYGKLLLQHAEQHGFVILNCNSALSSNSHNNDDDDDDDSNISKGTAHCVCIVHEGDRSFMSYTGCMDNFKVSDINAKALIATEETSASPTTTQQQQHQQQHCCHIHIAGYYNLDAFHNGDLTQTLQRVQSERHKKKHHSVSKLTPNALPLPPPRTTISLVPQHDASLRWDGKLLEVVPFLDFVIMNELEAANILQDKQQHTSDDHNQKATETTTTTTHHLLVEEEGGDDGRVVGVTTPEPSYQAWMDFGARVSARTCFIVTLGSKGAVAFRGGSMMATQSTANPIQDPVDPTGAGDAFSAGFIHGIWAWQQQQQQQHHTNLEKEKDELWPVEAIRNGLLWGVSAGTSCVKIHGASIPAHPYDIQKLVDSCKCLENLNQM